MADLVRANGSPERSNDHSMPGHHRDCLSVLRMRLPRDSTYHDPGSVEKHINRGYALDSTDVFSSLQGLRGPPIPCRAEHVGVSYLSVAHHVITERSGRYLVLYLGPVITGNNNERYGRQVVPRNHASSPSCPSSLSTTTLGMCRARGRRNAGYRHSAARYRRHKSC